MYMQLKDALFFFQFAVCFYLCLTQVIVALAEKGRRHIPYRNSMMTSVLRDSLGGNCMTSMIATCSVEKKNIDVSNSRGNWVVPTYNVVL